MATICPVCLKFVPRWHYSRILDAPPVAEDWRGYCLKCRVQCRTGALWFLRGWSW